MLTCCRAADPGPPRVAYAIGRRAGGAVDRNRVRRRLRHVIAAHEAQLRPDWQYLVGVRPEVRRSTPDELTAAWLNLIARAHEDAS